MRKRPPGRDLNIAPLNDRLTSILAGMTEHRLSDLAKQTVNVINSL